MSYFDVGLCSLHWDSALSTIFVGPVAHQILKLIIIVIQTYNTLLSVQTPCSAHLMQHPPTGQELRAAQYPVSSCVARSDSYM